MATKDRNDLTGEDLAAAERQEAEDRRRVTRDAVDEQWQIYDRERTEEERRRPA